MDELVVGTYEGYLLGYSVYTDDKNKKLKQTFATHSHTASVRCISTGGKFLASGGTDDKVVVIDLKTRMEHTVLMNHDGTINAVAFTHGGTHLLTGSDDGNIIVTRTGNWQIEKIWKKAHAGQPVTAIAIHPTDKLALSIGGDKTLRTWNLLKGRPAFTINLSNKITSVPTEIKFSPGGDRFSLVSGKTIDVWTISKAGIEKRITCNSKATTTQWTSDDMLYIGLENGNIISLTVSDTKALTYPAHKKRVKCVHYENNMLYSASSSGELKVWSTIDSNNMREICSTNAACRVTCVALNRQNHLIKKQENSDDENQVEQIESNIEEQIESNVEQQGESKLDSDEAEDNEEVTLPLKRKPGAFVTISYGNDDDDDNNVETAAAKKFKKRKRNKKLKKNKTSK